MSQGLLSPPAHPSSCEPDLTLSSRQRTLLIIVSLLLLLTSPFWVWALFFAGSYAYGSSLVLVPIFCFVNMLLIVSITANRPALGKVMMISYALKIASAGAYMALLFVYYVKGADASTYFSVGKQWAAYFSSRGSYPIVGHLWGTSFLNLLTAILVGTLGEAFPAISVLFATLAFWGIYFFYLSFRTAFPDGRKEFGTLLLFLFPSCQFWSAALGKDALMILGIGVASYGYSKLLVGQMRAGFGLLISGLALGTLVRPHVAGMLSIAMLLPYVLGKSRSGALAAVAKILGIPVMIAGVAYLVRNATQLLRVDSAAGGFERIEKFSAGTLHGGSAFGAGQSTSVKLLLSPFFVFRPLPWEVPNLLGVAACAEGLLLFFLLWRVRHALLGMLWRWRDFPFLTFTVCYTAIFSVVFTLALSNFGILIRQRTQLTPLILILVAAGWPRSRVRTA